MEAGKKTKKLSPYEKLRMEVIDYFDSVFRSMNFLYYRRKLNHMFMAAIL
jgi:hypothetical protein